jgi:hypothetical protein
LVLAMVLSDVLRCVLCNIVCPCWFWLWYCLTFFDVTSKNVRQYHNQNQQGQTMLCKTHRRTSDNTICITLFVLVGVGHGNVWRSLMCFVWHCSSDNTMAKINKDKQFYTKHIEERQTIPWPKHCLYLLDLAMVLSDVLRCVLYNIVFPCWFWPWYCLTFFDVFCIILFVLDNTMGKTNKDKQCYTKHIEERQTIPWPNPTRKTMRCVLYNIVCPCWFWPWYCLILCDVLYITLFFLVGFGHGIVWRSSMCFV